jgi:branched-chain amino acid transport system permease protein
VSAVRLLAPVARWRPRPSQVQVALTTVVLIVLGFSDRLRVGYVGLGSALFVAALGLVVVSGWTRQVNLAQYGFIGVGAFAAAGVHDLPFLFRALAGAGAAALVAVPVGLAASRLRGLALGALTLLVGLTLWTLSLTPSVMARVGGDTFLGVAVNRPSFAASDRVYAGFALGVAVVALALVQVLRVTRTGRAMTALGTSRAALAATGWDPRALVVGAFVVSAAFAGLGGVLLAANYGSLNGNDLLPFNSVLLYAFLFIGGADRPAAAMTTASSIPLVAALGLSSAFLPLVGGAFLIYAGAFMREGSLDATDRRLRQRGTRRAAAAAAEAPDRAAA